MRNQFKLILAALLLVPIVGLGVGLTTYAHGDEDNSATTTSETKEPDTTAEGIKQRLEAKKTELKTKLAKAEETKLKTKCQAAQGVVKNVQGRIKGIETSRGNVHATTEDKLEDLIARLNTKGVDTTQLQTQADELHKLIDTFKTDVATYNQAVSDLANMDCQTDPTAFKAALENARTAREKVAGDAKAVRAYVTDTIKPTLKEIRAQLESSTNTTTQ